MSEQAAMTVEGQTPMDDVLAAPPPPPKRRRKPTEQEQRDKVIAIAVGATQGVKRQCTATSRQSGQRCKKAPVPGLTVCRMHGGGTQAAKRKAALRLAELVDPAIATLGREMVKADKSADRQRAANSILDRAGVVRQGAGDAEIARALLLDRLRALRAQAIDEATKPDAPGEVVLDAEVVSDGDD